MIESIQYSLLIFLVLALLISVIYKEKLKQNDKKHIISGLYMILAAFIHGFVIIIRELM